MTKLMIVQFVIRTIIILLCHIGYAINISIGWSPFVKYVKNLASLIVEVFAQIV